MISVMDLTNRFHGYIDPESPIFVTLSPACELKPTPKPSFDDAHIRYLLNITLLAEPPRRLIIGRNDNPVTPS